MLSRKDLFNYASTDTKPTSVPAHSILIESDTGDAYEFDGTTWRQVGTAGAKHTNQQGGIWDYGTWPASYWSQVTGTGVNDNDVLFTNTVQTSYDEHVIHSTAGTVDVEVSVDGTNFTASGTNPMAMRDAHATASATYVTEVTVGKIGILTGKFHSIRVLQKGATAATAKMGSYKR